MSMKSTKADAKPVETENQAEKKEPTLESCQPSEANAQQRPPDGKQATSVMTDPGKVMTEQEISDLLARLQDILSLWSGSDNRIIGNFVMTVLPIPPAVTIDKVEKAGHNIPPVKIFRVNGNPIVSIAES